ncbi:MAG: 6-aminohexanoate hydrolase [Gammaproteobacteria bacterium]|jgi:CubicO group peptidase (beta-lactamase class C family)|nr:6-aminohexanoate hydrolase [Gammaproteobacteria bacterium]MEC7765891.1 serine hydrolase [Pseudomonadota bacterium]MAX03512.1 6-aminohexanoate hydrolase [Gammaproteobacteria bacterium]MBC60350.1 6-aminohexanoate hydrolase [Gammaproteobacteria bacterium]HAI16066.1 6-aminohexanoate hydrolase [Gammaproteobacteria bacterium]|tara:strand:- start:3903 stop:4943 length:1041 start_codon:yes stop_codon:yes gene_type:complete
MRNILLLILFVLFLPVVVNADELISNRSEFNSNFIDAHEAALRLPRLHSLLISHRGELVFEEYYNGADSRRPANMKSASKSVISALIGIAIDEGHIKSVEDPITKYFPEYIFNQTDPDKQLITIENLLTMQSGLETTSNRNYGKWVLSENWVEFVLNQPLVAKPGTRMLYSTGSTHLLSAILTRASGINTKEFAQKHLASQLGYSMSYWSRDPQGIYFGGNDMEMTPRQMLAFGELYLNKGVHEGRQIIPTNWVKESYRPHVLSPRGQGRYYGYGWWLRDLAGMLVPVAWGYGGQLIFVVEPMDLVVVATSDSTPGRTRRGHLGRLYNLVEDKILRQVSLRDFATR